MLRIRLGESWKHDPVCLEQLRALGEGRARGFSPRQIVDVVRVEVDGVDLTRGCAEAVLLDAVGDLLRVATDLCGSERQGEVALHPSGVILHFDRDGEEIRLRIEGLEAPVPSIQTDPVTFLESMKALARQLAEDLEQVHPGLSDLRPLQMLGRATESRPVRWRRIRSHRSPAPIARAQVGELVLCLQRTGGEEGPTILHALGRHGQRCWTGGRPALQNLLDLASLTADPAGAPAVEGVSVDVTRRLLSFGGSPPVPLAEVGDAVRALAEALASRVDEPDRRLLEDLPASLGTSSGAERRPLAPARTSITRSLRAVRAENLPTTELRRLILRRAWKADAPGPRPTLHGCGSGVLVRASGQVELRNVSGEPVWTASLLDPLVIPEARSRLVGRDGHGALLLLDGRTGRRLARHPGLLPRGLKAALGCGDDLALLGRRRVIRLDENGQVAWVFESWSDEELTALCYAGEGIAVANARAEVGAIASNGGLGWRRSLPLTSLSYLHCVPKVDALIAIGPAENHRGVVAMRLDALTGETVWSTVLDASAASQPAILDQSIGLGVETPTGEALALLSLRSGTVRWQRYVPGDGMVAPVAYRRRLLVPRSGGGLAAFESSGRILYSQPACDPDPALSPTHPRGAVVGAGLVALPSALVHVRDAETGRLVATVEPAELAPEACTFLDGPVLVVAGRDSGIVEAWRTTGHLRVIRRQD